VAILVETEPYALPAKFQMRIYTCALAAKYYKDTGRDHDPDNMSWTVVQRFHKEHKAILEKKKMDSPVAPKLSKGFAVHKWLESLNNHLKQVIGVCNVPLAYVVNENAVVDPVSSVLVDGEPYLESYGSVEGEMIARLLHSHALFKPDNSQVFDVIEAAIRGTAINPSIAQYCKTCDGCAAYMALKAQHAGHYVWDKLHREAEHKLQNQKWNGMTATTLSQHMGMHRCKQINLQDCAEHIPVKIPNGHCCVTYFDGINHLAGSQCVGGSCSHLPG
jgi:hypothetical protein